MKETGKVVEVKGDRAVVMMERSGKCGLCSKITGRQHILEVKNKEGVKEGDTVEIEIKEENLLKVCIYIYGFPLLGFIFGMIGAFFLKNIQLKFITFFAFFLSFWIAGFKKAKDYGEKAIPRILRVKGGGLYGFKRGS